jgi:hypothetical protein
MVNLGNLYKTFLLGDAWLEFESYPRKIGRVYTEDFVQEVSVVFAYGDDVVPFALHSFGIVLHKQQAARRVET